MIVSDRLPVSSSGSPKEVASSSVSTNWRLSDPMRR
jgi:hypothetical protein